MRINRSLIIATAATLSLLMAGCGKSSETSASNEVGDVQQGAADAFISQLTTAVATSPDDCEPLDLDSIIATTPENSEPVSIM